MRHSPDIHLQHRTEKWEPVFGKIRCKNKPPEHRADSDFRHDALDEKRQENTMKKFLVAGLIALGCITMTAAPSMAQDYPMTRSDRGYHQDRYDGRGEYRHHPRRFDRRERCRTRTIKYRHHGHWVIEKRTFCR
jgi:hypothetical protein